jgi:hypothetical protein
VIIRLPCLGQFAASLGRRALAACAVAVSGLGIAAVVGAGCGESPSNPVAASGSEVRAGEEQPGTLDAGTDARGLCGDPKILPINYEGEIQIRAVSVVEDPLRSQWDGVVTPANDQDGAWSFGRLFADMARRPDITGHAYDHCIVTKHTDVDCIGLDAGGYVPQTPAAYVEDFFKQWEVTNDVNCDPVDARSAVDAQILDSWPRTKDEKDELDLTRAPFRLLAIVRRPDLVDMAPPGTSDTDCDTLVVDPRGAGQLRFIFNLIDPATGAPKDFMIILEYNIPADSVTAADEQLALWHSLAAYTVGSDAYNTQLATLTRQITRDGGRQLWPYSTGTLPDGGAIPCSQVGRSHDNNVVAIRTQDRILSSTSQFREFRIGLESAANRPGDFYMQQSPRYEYRHSPEHLGKFIAANCGPILAQHFKVGQEFPNWTDGGDGGASCSNPVFNSDQFQAGQLPNQQTDAEVWDPGKDDASISCDASDAGDGLVSNAELRHLFAMNTCNGCHGVEVAMQAHNGLAAQPFHIQPRDAGQMSAVSRFLSGEYRFVDPLGAPRALNQRAIRESAYAQGICAN